MTAETNDEVRKLFERMEPETLVRIGGLPDETLWRFKGFDPQTNRVILDRNDSAKRTWFALADLAKCGSIEIVIDKPPVIRGMPGH